MSEDNPPIKRSTELAPLSREHHESLLFAWKIKQGLELQVQQARVAEFVKWYWNNCLAPHFAKEELLLVPFLSKNKALKNRLLEEHGALRKLVQEVETYPAADVMQKLAQVLIDHIRFEERILFKHLEVTLTMDELSEVGRHTASGDSPTAPWTDAFWLRN